MYNYLGSPYGYGGYGIVEMVLHLLWWVFVVLVIIAALRWLRHGRRWHHMAGMGSSAMSILRERYARGEIDKAEFEERKKTLEQNW